MYRHPSEQGERSGHLPQGRSDDDQEERTDLAGNMVERPRRMLSGRANTCDLGQVGPAWRATCEHMNRAAQAMAPSRARGRDREACAASEPEAVECLRPHSPGAENRKPSVGEGMILPAGRMRETRKSGLMSGGEETQARTGIEAPASGESRRKRLLSRSTARRASPRLYFARIKEFRAIATRCDKPGESFAAAIHLVSGVVAAT